MVTQLLHLQSFSKVWKSAVWQTFYAVVSKLWPRNIICGPLREHILFTYPMNFTANFEKIYTGYLELLVKTCDNVKLVIVWNVFFCLAFRSFKNTGPNNSMIFNRSKPVFWRSSSCENCNTLRCSYKHEAFQKVKHKLDLIEQPCLDK